MDSMSLNSAATTATTASAALASAVAVADGPTTALSSAMTRASDVVVAHGSSSWIGLIARVILWILQLLSTIIYFALKLTTISIPTLLFSLFSASLTVTMNATTLCVLRHPCPPPIRYANISPGCSSLVCCSRVSLGW